VFDVKLSVDPAQTGVLLPAVGVAGTGLITTADVPAGLVQPFTVTVTLYVPAMAVVAEGRVGVRTALVKEAGPVQAYVAPVTAAVLKLIVCPTQSGELVVAVGADGIGFTVMVMELLVAGLPVTPGMLDVITQVTTCPVVNADVVYVAPVPTLVPFTFH